MAALAVSRQSQKFWRKWNVWNAQLESLESCSFHPKSSSSSTSSSSRWIQCALDAKLLAVTEIPESVQLSPRKEKLMKTSSNPIFCADI